LGESGGATEFNTESAEDAEEEKQAIALVWFYPDYGSLWDFRG